MKADEGSLANLMILRKMYLFSNDYIIDFYKLRLILIKMS